jgi:hypothetical protein
LRRVVLAAIVTLVASAAAALTPDILTPARSVPPHVAGRFREARGLQQAAAGHYLVFDRRAHTVLGVDEQFESTWQVVEIGAEPGRVIDPTAFAVAPDGSFVIADAPRGQARVQFFSSAGFRTGGFYVGDAARPRLVIDNTILSGIGSIAYTGHAILISRPDTGALISEYSTTGEPLRAQGQLRATGHEGDRDVHLALNSGIPLATPDGGVVFVFQAGLPVFRRYDASGALVFERLMQGRELDEVVARLPSSWPRSPIDGELPLVRPTVRAAALAPNGYLWVAFEAGFVYVFDAEGDKVRALRLRGAGPVAPVTMAFGARGQLIVTPGLHEYIVD